MRLFKGAYQLIIGDIPPKADVFPYSAGKHEIVLQHLRKECVQLRRGVGAHIPPHNPYFALAWVVKTLAQLKHGAFAAARCPDNAQTSPLFKGKADIVQYFGAAVGEAYIGKAYGAVVPYIAFAAYRQVRLHIHYLAYALGAGRAFGIHCEYARNSQHGV